MDETIREVPSEDPGIDDLDGSLLHDGLLGGEPNDLEGGLALKEKPPRKPKTRAQTAGFLSEAEYIESLRRKLLVPHAKGKCQDCGDTLVEDPLPHLCNPFDRAKQFDPGIFLP